MGFSLEYGVHISKQNANKIYKLLWTHSFEMVLFLPFFSLSPHNDCIIFLSFTDHRRVRLCLLQNGPRHRITLYPPSRKVSFLFCFAFCVYVRVFTRPYTWSQYSWTLGSHLAGWRGWRRSEGSSLLTCRPTYQKRSVLGSKMWWFE